jgi:hypothetical protein
MLSRSRLYLALLFASTNAAHAVEGMWQPHQLQELAADVQAKGLQLDPKALGNLDAFPLNAVVGLGFCTASFVSPMGLVVTNHHCAYGTIQFNSKPERNLLRDGFLAKTIGDELPGDPTLRVYVTEAITDVSAQMRKGLPSAGRAAFDLIDSRQKALVAACEKGGGYRCDVYVFHGGASYYLVKQMEIRDVRLVYNPSESIGKFGGDTDNWIWPRHTADFSFIRAYVGPDGKPADYSSNNVPYRAKSYLKISSAGVKENDFVMIAGYPGRTNRYRLAEELDDAVNFTYPTMIARYQKVLSIIAEQSKNRPEAALKYAATVAGLNNGLKNFQGNQDGFAKLPVVKQKTDEEQATLAWMRKNAPNGEVGYNQLKSLLAQARALRNRDQILALMRQSGLYQAAFDLYRVNVERDKPDAKREYGYQQRDEVRVQGRLSALDKRWDAKVDRALTEYIWRSYLALDATERVPEIDAWLGSAEDLNAKLDALFAQTKLGDVNERMRLFKAGRKSLDQSKDPAIQMAAALMPAWLQMEDQLKTRGGIESRFRPIWMDARIAYAKSLGKPLYPDANSSLRVTYGNVMGYSPRDALSYAPFTSLEGIVEKHTGQGEFDATQKQLAAIKAKRFGDYAVNGTVPVNFISDLDITGGNSGSPTMNGKGELVGLAFDGNYEAISSGWVFNPKLTRTIHVDSRYMLWLMQEVDGADNLIKEMVIAK